MAYTAQEIIGIRDREYTAQANFRTLWQGTADYIFPRENNITSTGTAGEDKSKKVYDPTAILDSKEMASGLSSAIIPTGQEFFGLKVSDRELAKNDRVSRYLSVLTELTHDALFESNFMLQWNETLRGLTVFGTSNLYSEWDASVGGLNFKDYPIGSYQIIEDNHGNVDTMVLSFQFTAAQAIEEWGQDKVSRDIREAADDPKKASDTFDFIHYVAPRGQRNPRLEDNLNMPWSSQFVDIKAKEIIDEGGFGEFPFAVARWEKSSSETYGRGQGTEIVSAVRMLQVMMYALTDCANRWNNPPRKVRQGHDGIVNVTPGAINVVREMDDLQAMDQALNGNFPITEKILDRQQEIIHRAFYRDIFGQLSSLTGDRRTTTEIIERIREGLRRIGNPVSRIESEKLTPTISRSVRLLLRNGAVPQPPPELWGQHFDIEYLGELGLALRNQQAKGFVQWMNTVAQASQFFPEAADIPNIDRGFRRLAETSGVNIDDVNSEEEVTAKREVRAKQMQAQAMMQAADVASKAYKNVSGAAESGSPAEQMMGANNG